MNFSVQKCVFPLPLWGGFCSTPPRLDPHRLRDRRIHIHTVELIPTVTVIHTLTVAPIPTVTATLLNLTATVDKLTAIQLIPVSVKPSLSNHSWNFIVFKFVR